jgi:hypothetical protein
MQSRLWSRSMFSQWQIYTLLAARENKPAEAGARWKNATLSFILSLLPAKKTQGLQVISKQADYSL